jgi:hypothetical protein
MSGKRGVHKPDTLKFLNAISAYIQSHKIYVKKSTSEL